MVVALRLSARPLTVGPETSIGDAALADDAQGVRHLP
jgi:hypothetical protein